MSNEHYESEHTTNWPLFGRMATAYEFQWRRFGFRVVHLTGGNWGAWWFKPWQRVSFQWFGPGPRLLCGTNSEILAAPRLNKQVYESAGNFSGAFSFPLTHPPESAGSWAH